MNDRQHEYIASIQRGLDAVDTPEFRPWWEQSPPLAGEWFGTSAILSNLAFAHAVTGTLRGDEARLARARELVRQYAWCERDGSEHFHAPFAAETYKLLEASYTPEEKAIFQRHWIDLVPAALKQFLGDPPPPFEEWGHVSNHNLSACLYADLTRELFPEATAGLGFERLTDGVWDVWWKRREFWEQATNYEGFAELYLTEWARVRGLEDAFYGSPSILNMLRRGLEIVTPSGIVPAYGDSGHHEHATMFIGLFERVGAKLGDPVWSEAAQRIHECLRRLGLDEQPEHLRRFHDADPTTRRYALVLYLRMLSYLGLGALWAEGEPAPKPTFKPATSLIERRPVGEPLPEGDEVPLPCQVKLLGGPAENPTCVFISAGPKLVHDHADAGSILLVNQGDATLLGSNGYLARELAYHQSFVAQPAGGGFPDLGFMGDDTCAAEIESDGPGRCALRFRTFHGRPVALLRTVCVEEDGSVTVTDQATAAEPGYVGGPLWHAAEIEQLAPNAWRLRNPVTVALNGPVWRNGGTVLRATITGDGLDRRVRELPEPPIFDGPVYDYFPTRHYVPVWRLSRAFNQCLSACRELPLGETVTFRTRFEIVPA